MIRSQIQFTEAELERVRLAAQRDGVSVAEVVRRAVRQMFAQESAVSDAELRKRAVAAAGQWGSGDATGSADHDAHLATAFDP